MFERSTETQQWEYDAVFNDIVDYFRHDDFDAAKDAYSADMSVSPEWDEADRQAEASAEVDHYGDNVLDDETIEAVLRELDTNPWDGN